MTNDIPTFDVLSTPVWVVDPVRETLIFANRAARQLAGELSLSALRTGCFSACAETHLQRYLSDLSNHHEIVEIWTVNGTHGQIPLRCRLSLASFSDNHNVIIFEGANIPPMLSVHPARSINNKRRKSGFYQQLFMTTTAPMLLIDPLRDGLIVNANIAALRFYGYTSHEMRQKHTWEINSLGRQVLPIMAEIARLPGGHKPLNFMHKMADGSLRYVQTYAGPITVQGQRLMLCIVHDITEQKRLEQELEFAASRDPLTGLLNRRQFYALTESAPSSTLHLSSDYSLLLVDIDKFKVINDRDGHLKGDEVLIQLARLLESSGRNSDFIFRWGGEEFVLLLPRTPLDTAITLAEKIRDNVTKLSHPELPAFTVSIGVARHQSDETMDALFRRVDEALYQAKNSGRNRVLAA